MSVDGTTVEELLARNARWAALTVAAAGSSEMLTAALRAPGDPPAFARAAVATLQLDHVAEELADPDCSELAAKHLKTCHRLALALPAAAYRHEVIRVAAQDVAAAYRRIAALALRHRATRTENAGRPDEGHRLREQALPRAPAGSYLRAVLLIELGRLAEARGVIDETTGLDAVVMAELNVRAGRPAVAREILARAGATPAEHTWADLGRRAEIALALGDAEQADGLAARAVDAFERSLGAVRQDYYRALAGDHVAVAGMYNVAARARLELGDADGAFGLVDRMRAEIVRAAPDPAARRAEARLGATHERLAAAALRGDEPAYADVVAQLAAAEGAAEGATEAADGSRFDPATTLDDVRRALPGNAALLYYQSFDQDLIIWAVRRDGMLVERRHRQRRDLARAVRELHSACSGFAADGARVPDLGARVAADLIEPVAATLTGVDRLFVAPPGSLMLLPFAVLPLGGVPLGERYAVSVLPSAALLTRPGAGRQPDPDGPALLVGDPEHAGLPRLPGTGVEVRAIAGRLRSAVALVGPAATAEAFARYAPGRSIVHLATHGEVDELRPYLSRLALSGRDRLGLPDLAGLDLDIDLLVLSACHTGRGRATAGGDVLGLARAAIAAGARHLIVSLWPVDDVAACLLMTTLYRRLTRGHGVAEALACAARRIRAMDAGERAAAYARLAGAPGSGAVRDVGAVEKGGRGVGPAYWAPFIHIGV
ncbi:CHAT domain-containing protein [Actinoplanes sp. KI2]|uniref:CHAT domain-containing protein n=1 Tax=Actinoplanes sp. KI2 TaxID=2983315 RepID=UPI0021D58C8D|nr:CHAT domain-containing protein [Actinoplanes sp. KI2]MCU7728870.1 CHAT domain-containing protein [Actinoplanes sp. KI2]